MGIFLGLLFALLFLGAILLGIFFFKSKKKNKSGGLISLALSAGFLLAFIFIPFGFYQVESGEVAVIKQWGQIKSYKTAGLHFRNVVSDSYVLYDTKVQQIDLEKWCYVHDATGTTQVIQVISSVQFNLNENNVAAVAKEYGSLDALQQRIVTVILGVLETSASNYTIDQLVTGSGKLDYQNRIKELLTSEKTPDNKTVENLYYISFRQITIEEFVLEPALEAAMLKVRLAEADRKEREEQLKKETAEIEARAKQDEIKAHALREIEKANAENEILIKELLAQAKEIEATGEANALIERARGEAESLRVKSIELARSIGINILADSEGNETIDSTDPNIDSLAAYLEYIAYLEAWDGKLPEIVGGDLSLILPVRP